MPEDFGIMKPSANGEVLSLEEKPKNPKFNYAVPEIYFYNNDVIKIAKKLKPSVCSAKDYSNF